MGFQRDTSASIILHATKVVKEQEASATEADNNESDNEELVVAKEPPPSSHDDFDDKVCKQGQAHNIIIHACVLLYVPVISTMLARLYATVILLLWLQQPCGHLALRLYKLYMQSCHNRLCQGCTKFTAWLSFHCQ